MPRVSSQQGYTLIELLLYIALLGILLPSMIGFMGLAVDVRVKNQSVNEVNEQGLAAMDYITQTIRNSTSISAPAAAGSGSSLTLVVPTASLSPTVFDVSDSTLRVKEGTGAAIPLTNSKVQVSNLTFSNLTRSGTSGIVQVSFIVSRVNTSDRNEYDYQKTFTTSAEVAW